MQNKDGNNGVFSYIPQTPPLISSLPPLDDWRPPTVPGSPRVGCSVDISPLVAPKASLCHAWAITEKSEKSVCFCQCVFVYGIICLRTSVYVCLP